MTSLNMYMQLSISSNNKEMDLDRGPLYPPANSHIFLCEEVYQCFKHRALEGLGSMLLTWLPMTASV